MANAAIYARISDDREGRGLGVARQEADCRAFCGMRGWRVARVFVDNDTSAYRGRRRPGYSEMLDALKAGEADTIVCWHPDRLHRNPRELEDFITIIESTGATVASVTAGDYDLSTPDGRLTARIVGSVARKESEDRSRRSRRKHLELAEAGKPSGGSTRPFGYEHDFITLRADEAALIRDAATRVLAGESLVAIAAEWNARGVTTTHGNRWRNGVLRRVLMSHRIAGMRSHDGAAVAKGAWPAIIDADTSRRLRLLLSDPARRSSGSNVRSHLLSGLLLCGHCGARLVPHPRTNGPSGYSCKRDPQANGCGRLRILAVPLEELVVERLFEVLDAPGIVRAMAGHADDAEEQRLLTAIDVAEAHLKQLARDYYAEHIINRQQFLAASRDLEGQIAVTRRKLTQETKRTAAAVLLDQAKSLRGQWDSDEMTLSRKRGVLTTMLESITVSPAGRNRNRFDPERVPYEAFAWRL